MPRDTRFLLSLDKEEKELYILHREFPRCLIYVEQTMPINFVVFDLFEDISDEEAVRHLTDESFKSDLKDFFNSQAFDLKEMN
jgi:hypothetical protein